MKIICFIALFFTPLIQTQPIGQPGKESQGNEAWKLEKDKDGIKVYTRHVEGYQIKEFKAVSIIEAKMEDILTLVLDAEHYAEWMSNTTSAKTIKTEENGDFLVYYQLSLPWPMQDRDAISQNQIISGTDSTVIRTVLLPDYLPADSKLVRMKVANGGWVFKPLADNRCHLTYQFVADPSTKVPGWIANLFVVESPYKTIFNLKERLEKK